MERQIYFFLAAVLVAISLTSLYTIRSNRMLFDRLAVLSGHRSELARKLITVQEEVFHSLSRELHDEFGQILTAIGAMLSRAEKKGGLPPDSPFRTEVAEVREIAQSTIEKIRSLSQVLHPTVLDDGGLEKTIDWYVPTFQKQTGIAVRYEKTGTSPAVSDRVAINVYRVLQEALNNMAQAFRSSDRLGARALRARPAGAGSGRPRRRHPRAQWRDVGAGHGTGGDAGACRAAAWEN